MLGNNRLKLVVPRLTACKPCNTEACPTGKYESEACIADSDRVCEHVPSLSGTYAVNVAVAKATQTT